MYKWNFFNNFKVTKKGFQVWVIPHTFKLTNLSIIKKEQLS